MSKEEKQEKLYSSIGMIDEKFVQEADEYTYSVIKTRRRHTVIRRVILIAAAVLLLNVILITAALKLAGSSKDYADEYQREDRLERVLIDAKDRSAVCENIDLFSGQTTLYWKYQDSDELYYRCVADSASSKELIVLSGRSASARVSSRLDMPTVRLWVCDGHGNVITPYIAASCGNTSLGRLFDYNPEIFVSDEYAELVSSLIS